MGLVNDLPFSCSNDRFETDINHKKGKRHGSSLTGGAVFTKPLTVNDSGLTLWLEYVVDKSGPGKWSGSPLWFMWYDQDGNPTNSESATFDISHIKRMMTRFIG